MVKYILALALFFLVASPAWTCPVLERAEPRVGDEVKVAAKAVTLRFSGPVIVAQSELAVKDAHGKTVSTGKPYGSAAKDNADIAIHIPTLAPGDYTVDYNVFCDCGSYTPGSYGFTVTSK